MRASHSASSSRASACSRSARKKRKGNELTREAHRLLKGAPLNFIGNIEARDVYSGDADVIVCDGFTGNVALKISEGLVETIERPAARGTLEHHHDARGIAPHAARDAAFPASRGLLGVRRRAAPRSGGHHDSRTWTVERKGRPQRSRHGIPVRVRVSSFERVEREIAVAAVPHQ